jgi:hypothetical protein
MHVTIVIHIYHRPLYCITTTLSPYLYGHINYRFLAFKFYRTINREIDTTTFTHVDTSTLIQINVHKLAKYKYNSFRQYGSVYNDLV